MIELKNISFSYREKKVLDGLGFSLARGELCALIGKNGCGKTTLARLIGRQSREGRGELLLDGRPYAEYSGKEFARRVSFFSQTRPVPNMNVYDYVAYGRYPYSGASFHLSAEDREKVARALALTDTERFCGRNVCELSGGERQLVYLAMLAAQDADFAILDEPTAFMDAANCFAVTELLQLFAAEGKGVLAVLHDITHALRFFSRVAVMKDGAIIYDGSPDGAVESSIIEDAFGVACERLGEEYVLKKK